MENGWIKLHRSMKNWEWYQDPNTSRIFIHLLLSANHEEGRWKGIKVEKGSLITGRKMLAKDTGLSEQIVRTCLNRLKSTNEITIKTTNKYSVITINKWEEYQCSEDISTNKTTNNLTNNQPTINQQITTNKNNKNIRNKEIDNILSFLNQQTNKSFRRTSSFDRLVNSRLEEGFTEEDFKKVILTKCEDWLNDSKMNKYLRPDTLFRPNNFQAYLNQNPNIVVEEEKTSDVVLQDQDDAWEQYKKENNIVI